MRRDAVRTATRLSAEERLTLAQEALLSRRPADLVALDVRSITLIADYFLICSGTSNIHMRALADAVEEAMREQEAPADGIEGYQEARWILLDCGEVIIHIFSEEDRAFYALERLWGDAARLPVGD